LFSGDSPGRVLLPPEACEDSGDTRLRRTRRRRQPIVHRDTGRYDCAYRARRCRIDQSV